MAELRNSLDRNQLAICIFDSTVFVVTLPLYLYGAAKFWQLREHLLIRKRFPTISATIVLMVFIAGAWNTATSWTNYLTSNRIQSIGDNVALLVYGLINLRLCLIYLRWKRNTANSGTTLERNMVFQLQSISIPSPSASPSSDPANTAVYKNKKKNIFYHWSCLFILTSAIFSFIYMTITIGAFESDKDAITMSIIWTLQIIVSIILILIIVFKKVNEGIGCLKETIVLLLMAVFVMCIVPLTFISDIMALIAAMILHLDSFVLGLIPLFFALYYVKNVEGTLKIDNVRKRQATVIHYEDPLFVFIEQYENYQLLKKYLSHCWALENLLFYEKVSIWYQIVIKYKNICNAMQETDIGLIQHRNKFEFLPLIYCQYEAEIGDVNAEELRFEDIRLRLWQIQRQIFEEFIMNGANNEINLPFSIRSGLTVVLEKNDSINKFKSFDDFLYLFDEAIISIYQLISSMYKYKFREYVETKESEK